MTKTILVDMDGVLADFNKKKYELIDKDKFPEYPHPKDKKYYYDFENPDFSQELKNETRRVVETRDFFLSLEVLDGAVEAIKEMIDLGLNVIFCTSPFLSSPTCVEDKFRWIEKHFGYKAKLRLVLTKDKSLVKGDFLIDDKPTAAEDRSYKPEWKHLVFEQNYNKGLFPKEDYINWKNWREVLRNHGVEI